MESFLSRYRNLLVLLAVVLAQMLGLAVQVRRSATGSDMHQTRLIRYWMVGLISPLERVFLHSGHGVSGLWSNYIDLRHVRAQNQQLQAELDRMRLEEASLAEAARQDMRLQKLMAFQQQYVSKTVAAHVIGTSGTDLSRVLYIDKGSADGICMDIPVITPDGVVGKIRDVFPHAAQVLEINDPTSGLGVVLTQTRLRGILRGNTAGQTEIIDILPDERIQSGEAVITSGGDQVYPSGLPVGTVDRVISDPERNPYVAVLIRPAANLSRLDEVLVITQTQTTPPANMHEDIITSEQKAADILAQRLPGSNPPQTTGPDGKPLDADAPPPPVRPPMPLHPDHFTPGATPDAANLSPGASYPKQVFAPTEATPARKTPTPGAPIPGPPTPGTPTHAVPNQARVTPQNAHLAPSTLPLKQGQSSPSQPAKLQHPVPAGTSGAQHANPVQEPRT